MYHRKCHLVFQNPILKSSFSLIIILYTGLSSGVYSQSRTLLEQDRMKIIEQIEHTTEVLNKTQIQRERTLAEAELLESRIRKRNSLVQMTSREILLVSQEIEEAEGRIDGIEDQIRKAKNNYGELIRAAYMQKATSNNFAFILSSGRLNAFFQRWRFINQLEDHIVQQIDLLRSKTLILGQIIAQLKTDKEARNDLMKSEMEIRKALEQDLRKKDEWVLSLQQNERLLADELDNQKKAREQLNRAIENVIIASLSATKRVILDKDEEHLESLGLMPGGLDKNMGKLVRPLDGSIVLAFGKQKHPVVPNVEIENKGIDIQGEAKSQVSAIYDGKVVHTSHIAGQGSMIIIQHGEYYSVYSKLANVSVSEEQDVKAGELIGATFGYDNEKAGILHLEIWKGQETLNPSKWIR